MNQLKSYLNLLSQTRGEWRGNFLKLITVRWLGQFADGIFQSSLATFILFSPEREPTALSAATAFAVVLLPYSLVGPIAGTFLDRFSRQKTIEYTNYARGIFLILVAFLLKSHSASIFLTVVVLIVFGFGRLILAGLSAGLPIVVKKEEIISLNAITVTLGTLFQFIGIGIGGSGKALLDRQISSDDSSAILVLIAILIYFTSGFYSRKIPKFGIGPVNNSIHPKIYNGWKEIVDGFKLIKRHGQAGRGILATSIARGGETALVMSILLLERNTFNPTNKPDAGLKSLGLALFVAAIGIGLGALTTPIIVQIIGRHFWMRSALLFSVPFFILIGFFPNQSILYLVAFFVGGLCQGVKVTNDALLQMHIADEFRGRIFAFYDIAVNVGLVSGALFAAWLLPVSGKSLLLNCLIASIFIFTSLWILRPKYFRR